MRLGHLAKVVAHGALSRVPALRRVKRALVPYRDDPSNSWFCITNGLEFLAMLRAAGVPVRGATVLEFGTGWLPLIPLLFHLAGARSLVLTDIVPLMDTATIDRARQLIAARIAEVATVLEQPADTLLRQLEVPPPIEYLVPWDAEAQPAASVDIVFSRAVLEHVPEPQIRFFFREFNRILRPGGVMCHLIDNSDHWQHTDRGLSRLDFLRYDENALIWRLAQLNEQGYQNRLRHGEYAQMIREAGFEIIEARGEPDPKCLEDLGTLPLSSRFRGMEPGDLAILLSTFLARRS